MIRTIPAIVLGLAVSACAVQAQVPPPTQQQDTARRQQQPYGQRQQGPHMDMQMMFTGVITPGTILQLAEELELTPEQHAQLEQLQQQYEQQVEPNFQRAMEAHHRAVSSIQEAETPQVEQYEQQLKEAMDLMVRAHVAAARASVQAREILNEEQRAQLKTGMTIAQHMMKGLFGGQGVEGEVNDNLRKPGNNREPR